MNRLGAAFYILSQGIPFMHAGEEMLRSKPHPKGGFVENSFKSPDSVNSIKWDLLEREEYKNTLEYYKGLIQFRKAHPALRMTSAYDVLSNLVPVHCEHPHIGAFHLRGDVLFESASDIFMIFSAAGTYEKIPLPAGTWKLVIANEISGTKTLKTIKGSVTVPPISAVVLVKE